MFTLFRILFVLLSVLFLLLALFPSILGAARESRSSRNSTNLESLLARLPRPDHPKYRSETDLILTEASNLSKPERLYLAGRAAFASGNMKEALDAFKVLREEFPIFLDYHPDVERYISAAKILLEDRNSSAALENQPSAGDVSSVKETNSISRETSSQREIKPGLSRRRAEGTEERPMTGSLGGAVVEAVPELLPFPSPNPSPAQPAHSLTSTPELLEKLEGEILVLHFWASWCQPCRREIPSLTAFLHSDQFKVYEGRGVRPVFVTIDNYLGEGEAFLEQERVHVPLLLHDPNGKILTSLAGDANIPRTILFRRQDQRVSSILPVQDWNSREIRGHFFSQLDKAFH